MKTLITGGHTEIPIDKVRSITNIFKGRTAFDLAEYFVNHLEVNKDDFDYDEDYNAINREKVHLIGNKNMQEWVINYNPFCDDIEFSLYRTYEELYSLMEKMIKKNNYDVIIHSAAVSDYKVESVMVEDKDELIEIDSSKKISSNYDALYLKLIKTEKIIDKIREWGFKGTLVKFKLQIDMSDEELIEIAKKSREDSDADIIVANCLEWAKERAIIITKNNIIEVKRENLGERLFGVIKETRNK